MASNFNVTENADKIAVFKEQLNKLKGGKGILMQALHDAQHIFGYIPAEIQELISKELRIPMAEIYGVITFYSRFTLEPKGKCQIGVCLGTACYVKGSGQLLEQIEQRLGIKNNTTSEDGKFSLNSTRCVGACGLAPVITINEEVHGRLSKEELVKILDHLKAEDGVYNQAVEALKEKKIEVAK